MQKKETSIEVKVGALVLFATSLLVAFVLVLGDFSFGDGFTFDVEFNNAGGLKPGADVAIAGINVGNVEKLRFIQNPKETKDTGAVAVRATLRVTAEYAEAIRQNSDFFITTRGVLGEPYIEIVTQNFETPPIKSGDVLRGVDPPRMDIIVARATELLTTLNELFDDPNIQTRELISNTASQWVHSIHSSSTTARTSTQRWTTCETRPQRLPNCSVHSTWPSMTAQSFEAPCAASAAPHATPMSSLPVSAATSTPS
ncbi:MAG: MlaD family protein [bacterium]